MVMLERLRGLSPTHPVGRWLRLARLATRPLRRQDVVHREALRQPGLRFIQIGANDGVIADPLHPFIEDFGWTGVLVEPQPAVFEDKLSPLYCDNERVTLINAAVGAESGSMPLYVLSFSDERWATGKATLDREILQRSVDSGLIDRLVAAHQVRPPEDRADWITSISVPVVTVAELLSRSGMVDFDLLHVDTEGADGLIVRQFDFSASSCRLVQFEHVHLTDDDLALTCAHLERAGYTLYHDKMDCLAVRNIRVGRTTMNLFQAPWVRSPGPK